MSKVAGCQQKSPPTWLVSASYSASHFFTDGDFKQNIPGLAANTLITQPSTSKRSDNPVVTIVVPWSNMIGNLGIPYSIHAIAWSQAGSVEGQFRVLNLKSNVTSNCYNSNMHIILPSPSLSTAVTCD